MKWRAHLTATGLLIALGALPALAKQDSLDLGECAHPLAIERSGELAHFVQAPLEMTQALERQFSGAGLSLDALYVSHDARMWLAIAHHPGSVNLPMEAWSKLKERLTGASKADFAPETRSLTFETVRDEGERYLLVSRGSGDSGQGIVEASIGEAWDVTTGCLVRVTLRADSVEATSQIDRLLSGLRFHRR